MQHFRVRRLSSRLDTWQGAGGALGEGGSRMMQDGRGHPPIPPQSWPLLVTCHQAANFHGPRMLSPQHPRMGADMDGYDLDHQSSVPSRSPSSRLHRFHTPLHAATFSGLHTLQLEPSRSSTIRLGQGLGVRPRIPKSLPLFTGQVGSSRLPSRARCPGRSKHVDSSE